MRRLLQLRQPRRDFVWTLRRRALARGEGPELLVLDEGLSSELVLGGVSRGLALVEGTAESKLVYRNLVVVAITANALAMVCLWVGEWRVQVWMESRETLLLLLQITTICGSDIMRGVTLLPRAAY
jgi:hypothetical protein